ncbi:MAG TPA: PASTA domain-containing protein, partial [Acidimicrobiales bacterium]|nr:PASTA domain-containing protein [Acidimicrobiales bacterium]
AAMAKADLYYQTTGPGSANGTWVRVVGQKPRAGTAVAARSTVTLTTSSARARATTRAEVRVPNVVHLTKAQVIRVFKKDGLTLRATGPGSANGTWVRVVGQSPRAGTKITRHGVVTLTTTRARTPRPTTTSPPTTSTAPTSSSTTSSLPGSSTDVTTTSPTTTSPPTTTTTTTQKVIRRRPHRYRVGVATWYSYIPGRCATSYLPMGTRVTVRDLASGRTIHCVVTDRQAVSSGRVVDLSETQFSLLAPLWRGVVRVKVSW